MCTSFLWNNVSIGKPQLLELVSVIIDIQVGWIPPFLSCHASVYSYLISITILSIHRHHWSHSELDRILIPIWFSHGGPNWNLGQLIFQARADSGCNSEVGNIWYHSWCRGDTVRWYTVYNLYTVIYTRCSGDTTPLTVCIHCCAAAAVGKLFEFIRHFVAVRFRNCPFWRSYTPDTGWHESSQGLHWSQAVCDGASRKNRFCFKIWDFRPIFTLFPVGCRRWTC